MIRLAIVVAVISLSGCVSRMYEWNDYDMRLYQYYKNPASAEAFRVEMEAHFKLLESKNLRPAPGLYAEVGTLFLQNGDRATASTYYNKERAAWPESRPLMDALLKNLDKMSKKKSGEK